MSALVRGRQLAKGEVAAPRQRAPRWARFRPDLIIPWAQDFLKDFTQGLSDSISLHRPLPFLIESPTVRLNAVKSILLNGVLFLGSHHFYHLVLAPGLQHTGIQIYSQTAPPSLPPAWLEALISYCSYWAYQLTWMWPFYLLSFFVSLSLNQEVALAAFQCREQPPAPPGQAPIPVVVVDTVNRILMVYLLLFQTVVLSWVPWVGGLVSFLFTCWLDAFYAFQYVWALRGVRVERQTRWIEDDWAYHLGFGCLTSLACHCTAFFVGAGCYAMIFPFCILTAMTSEPRGVQPPQEGAQGGEGHSLRCRAPVFWVARRLSSWIMGTVNASVNGKRRR